MPISAAVAAPLPAALAEGAGERRYLTVVFCDLVGSTGIAAQLDAEEWRDLVGAYLDAASAAVTEMGGHVAKKLGDGLMALFGYPVAQENDAERAARAALAIQRALAELNRKNAGSGKPVLAARIGLETGPAVVDAAGEIYGDVANVAPKPGASSPTSPSCRSLLRLLCLCLLARTSWIRPRRHSHEAMGYQFIPCHGNCPDFTFSGHTSAPTCAFKGLRGGAYDATADAC